ncbi:hypothetical protein ACPESR_25705 [Nocardia testacea]|uniref:hypothetical protein n=1 Tax=Nocardia testacea TaxID=248551 RepID=UPI003C2E1258
MTALRRTVVLCRPDTPGREIHRLADRYGLEVVYTVFTDIESSQLTALIAIQHIIENNAEVLVIPHLTAMRIARHQRWKPVLAAAQVIASDGPIDEFTR